jgi:transcriptional regulator with XRE-family HTH domain
MGYFEGRFSGLVHQGLLKLLRTMEKQQGFSRRRLAHRLGKKPEQITRWFSSPANLTVATISNLFLGAGYEIRGFVIANMESGDLQVFPENLQLERPAMPAVSAMEFGASPVGRETTGTSRKGFFLASAA